MRDAPCLSALPACAPLARIQGLRAPLRSALCLWLPSGRAFGATSTANTRFAALFSTAYLATSRRAFGATFQISP
jgi:hypothetical protein